MTYQSDTLARVGARVEQGSVQGFSRSFLRRCKGCNGSAQPCLTYMCAHAQLRMLVGFPITLAILATLAVPYPQSPVFRHLAVLRCARVEQGFGPECKRPLSSFEVAARLSIVSSAPTQEMRDSRAPDVPSMPGRALPTHAVVAPPRGGRNSGGVPAARPLTISRGDFFLTERVFRVGARHQDQRSASFLRSIVARRAARRSPPRAQLARCITLPPGTLVFGQLPGRHGLFLLKAGASDERRNLG